MSRFWNMWVWALTLSNLVACLWLLQAFTRRGKDKGQGQDDTTGHRWDGDLTEYNNPLPRWWLSLFWVTAVFMVVYLLLYPGLGNFAGFGRWTQTSQYDTEVARAEQRYGNVYGAFAATPVAALASNPDALRLGRSLFLNRCATCHGSDGRGAKGFPNLTDAAWLYGGGPDAVVQTITDGRTGVMPPLGAALGQQGLDEIVAYLRSIGPRRAVGAHEDDDAEEGGHEAADLAAAGQQKFATFCSACHGADAKGNQAVGAPDLSDGDWLHGPADADIRDVINSGRANQMPAQKDRLTADRIHVLAGYVLSLGSRGGG